MASLSLFFASALLMFLFRPRVPSPSHTPPSISRLAPLPPGPVEVGIVGGGIAGMALALALQRRGVKARVFERDAAMDSRAQGNALTISLP
ncbi:hypothetical protein T484DRAFT_1852904 [Baffinella frigidus]|nr:hypothetical protein T484DRAFT_1852904 [Cryptophyta sp. CCMP2293]